MKTKGNAIQIKIARLRSGKPLRVLDLFSGCGGLSLGFDSAGFEITASIELDEDAAKSHGLNFHAGSDKHCQARDITKTSPSSLCDELEIGKASDAFDVLVGGPPCQAFARVGRSKLREVADHPEAFRHDPRARLYSKYLDYVKQCQPLVVVVENVPDMLNHGGHNLAEEICDVLSHLNYRCGYTLLNSAFYGVPQMRERMFLIALHRDIGAYPCFPRPTHWIQLPTGYEGSRQVALKLLGGDISGKQRERFISHPIADVLLPPAITAKEALHDLPRIEALKELKSGHLKRGARKFDVPINYSEPSDISEYAKKMRHWFGFEGREKVFDHVIRCLPRDYKIFARMSSGDQYPQAHELALKMFDEHLESIPAKNRPFAEGDDWRRLRDEYVPPYDPGKFPNKWRKMESDKPARTLLAHLGKDGYSHIHYDSSQARTISVREAARLQSFPDGFKFSGTMNPAFRQIGNAVPPLMAKAIAESVKASIELGILNMGNKLRQAC